MSFRLLYLIFNRLLGWLALLGLWVPETRLTLCDLLVFVDEAAESVDSADARGAEYSRLGGAVAEERLVPIRGAGGAD